MPELELGESVKRGNQGQPGPTLQWFGATFLIDGLFTNESCTLLPTNLSH